GLPALLQQPANALNPAVSEAVREEGEAATFFLILGIKADTHPPSLPSRGRGPDRPVHVGRERRPRRSGLARHARLAGQRSRSSRGSPPTTTPALRPERPRGAEKAWAGDLQTPCGSAGEARLYIAASCPALPHPSSRPGHTRAAASPCPALKC